MAGAKKGSPAATAAGETVDAAGERTVIVSGEQHAREQLARDMAAMREHPLDRAKAPGGVYLVGGKYVDANGNAVKAPKDDADNDDE